MNDEYNYRAYGCLFALMNGVPCFFLDLSTISSLISHNSIIPILQLSNIAISNLQYPSIEISNF